jgi:hypothetical protein
MCLLLPIAPYQSHFYNSYADSGIPKTGPLQFRKQVVAYESFESVGVFDRQ